MTKDEYVKKLKKYYDDNKLKETDSYGKCYTYGLAEALVYAIGLAGKLDEPKKVIIPHFVDDWIENARLYYDDESDPLRIIFWMGEYVDSTESHYEWLNDIDNQKLLLNAVINGYEVERQKKYRVKIDSKLYFQRFENTEAVFLIDDSLGAKESSPVFTREVGNKILETLGVESGQLEEVEDD